MEENSSSTALVLVDKEAAERTAKANDIVAYFSLGTAGLSIIPIPLVDVALFGLAQIAMARTLAEHYKIPFKRHIVKSLIGSIVGGTLPLTVAILVRAIPGVGECVGRLSFTAAAAASTYGLGRVFIQHFESGGTFLTLDPEQVRDYYAQQVAAGAAQQTDTGEYAGVRP